MCVRINPEELSNPHPFDHLLLDPLGAVVKDPGLVERGVPGNVLDGFEIAPVF